MEILHLWHLIFIVRDFTPGKIVSQGQISGSDSAIPNSLAVGLGL